jgi:hypothetical protein
MKIKYQNINTAHNMVLFQGGLAGNFLSYLIGLHSLKLSLGNPLLGNNEYSMSSAIRYSDDPYCNSFENKALILEQHLNLFFRVDNNNEVYTPSRYNEVLDIYQDTKIVVITVDTAHTDLLRWISKLHIVKAFHNDQYDGDDGDWGDTNNRTINPRMMEKNTEKLRDSMSHYKWFIDRAKKKNIDVLEVDYKQLFIDRDEKVIGELFNFPRYSQSFDLNDVCNEIEQYTQRNMMEVNEFEKLIPFITKK